MAKKVQPKKAVKIKVCDNCNGRGLIGNNELAVNCEICNATGQVKE